MIHFKPHDQGRIRQRGLARPKSFMPPLLLILALFLAGCAPAEKTLPLPQASLSEEETQESRPVRDFTVKKIYTYTYETRSELGKSAFLQGTGENEIAIISQSEEDADKKLEYRQVDYRYGFYDTVGDFFWTWEEWNNPEGGEMEGDLYIDRLIPSPDGKRLLVYLHSAFWDRLIVWLYTLGEEQPRLLYEGTETTAGLLIGSFSPSGRWVTFDAGGAITDPSYFVPVYDCEKETPAQEEPWTLPSGSAQLAPPDHMLSTTMHPSQLWDAGLYDGADKPVLFLFHTEGTDSVSASRISLPEQESVPDPYLMLGKDPLDCLYQSSYLPGYDANGTPYPQYSLSADASELTYLGTPYELWYMDMTDFQTAGKPIQFPDLVWDFRKLDSGDLLAAIVQETGNSAGYLDWKDGPQNSQRSIPTGLDDKNSEENAYVASGYRGNCLPVALQEFWNIKSADLYLYPQGELEGRLLYKNLRNLVAMEYDEATGRILLETYEGDSLSHRRCIILEL